MGKHEPIRRPSLIERADARFDFSALVNQPRRDLLPPRPAAPAPLPAAPPVAGPVAEPVGEAVAPIAPPTAAPPTAAAPATAPAARRAAPVTGRTVAVDRARLRAGHFIVPEDPVSRLAEEFRIAKRALLTNMNGAPGQPGVARGERILICSAHPDEGKSWVSVNLALSMAAEKDNRVLLVDADFAKPSLPQLLGLAAEEAVLPGLLDTLADPSIDVERLILRTDIPGLSILPAGTPSRSDTELIASRATEAVLARLTESDPARVILFDSPPILAASPASVLAMHVGQALMVVRAEKTGATALDDALSLIEGCEHVQLLLNGTSFSSTGRTFGSYYKQGNAP